MTTAHGPILVLDPGVRGLPHERLRRLRRTRHGAVDAARHTRRVATLDPWAPADPLGEALHFLRMNGAFYCRSELTAPWGMTMMPMPGYVWFHVVTTGRVWLEAGDAEPTLLQPGTSAWCRTARARPVQRAGRRRARVLELDREEVSDRYEILRHGGGGAPTMLVCGAVRFDHPAARNLVEILPPLLHVEASGSPEQDWMQSTLRLMAVEARELRPGGEAVITRLGDILVVQAIRSWIETDPAARTGWLGALQDRQIGRALSLIHRDPARAWTVASLADELAMSRSAFAARFTELVDEPAMQLRHALADAGGRRLAQGGGRDRRRAREPARLPLRGRLRAGFQARDRGPAGRGQAGRPVVLRVSVDEFHARARLGRPHHRVGDLRGAVAVAQTGAVGPTSPSSRIAASRWCSSCTKVCSQPRCGRAATSATRTGGRPPRRARCGSPGRARRERSPRGRPAAR